MAKVYGVNVELANNEQLYIRADSKDEAFNAAVEYLRSDEGRAYFRDRMSTLLQIDFVNWRINSLTFEMSDAWPSNMVNLDVSTHTDPDAGEETA